METKFNLNGKVLHTESGIGIPDIQVCINLVGDKNGCVVEILTDEKGRYQIELDETDLGSKLVDSTRTPSSRNMTNSKELTLIFKAPSSPDGDNSYKVLGQTEPQKISRLISRIDKLGTKTLKKAGIKLPDVSYSSGNPVQQELVSKSYRNRIKTVERAKVKARSEKLKGFKKALFKSISKAGNDDREYLNEGEDIQEKQEIIIKESIDSINNESVNAEGVIILTTEQKEILDDYKSNDELHYENVPSHIIDSILFPDNNEDNPSFLLRNNPISLDCKNKTTEEKCTDKYLNGTSAVNAVDDAIPTVEGDNSDSDGSPLTIEDIPKYLGNLIHFQSSPEEKVYFGEATTSRRPNQQDVQDSINSFVLEKGPADSVAYFDFKSLNIAFQHVWAEAIDEGVLDASEDIYDRLVDLTGSPFDPTRDNPSLDEITKEGRHVVKAINTNPDANVIKHFTITYEEWNNLPQEYQDKLILISEELNQKVILPSFFGPNCDGISRNEMLRIRQQGNRIIEFAKDENFKSLHKIIVDLNKRLRENYLFTTFPVKENGKRSINFGLDITYRQKWEPINYQAGELAKTVTLAPKEERKFSYKTVIKRKRSEKEAEKRSSAIRDEMNTTSRTEAEIVQKAMKKTDFNLSYDGYFKTSLSISAQRDSQETKKDFREAVQKSSQEFKSERSTEITTEESFESEFSESGTISNPNDELAVTYLFYELQRRYRISEEIHRLTPVIMVAEEVPDPHEIDEHWLIANDWILNRTILDDSFLPALTYLSTSIVGDEHAIEELKINLEQQRAVVDELKLQISGLKDQVKNRYEALERAINYRINMEERDEGEGAWESFKEYFRGDGEQSEAAKAREQAATDAHEYAVAQSKEMASKLYREIDALNAMTEKYTNLLSKHLNQKTQIVRLKVHVKDNIIYYMQAIWRHEPPDQRFMRLYNVEVPHFEATTRTYNVEVAPTDILWTDPQNQSTAHSFEMSTNIKSELTYKKLVEVADVSNPIGYMGNYIIFPLTVPNALTDYMMTPYVDSAFGLHDPDEFGNMNLRDYAKYICCLHAQMTEDEFTAIKPVLKKYYERLLTSPLRPGEDIIVPTDSLFIEALPAKHALLEDFKLMHRAIDVKKVQAEAREMEIDNLRQAARILEAKLEDPDVDKKIIVEGNALQTNIDIAEDSV